EIYDCAGQNTFVNEASGVLSKHSGTATTMVSIAVNNAGTIEANGGRLELTGGFPNFSPSQHALTGGTYVVGAVLRFTGADVRTLSATIRLTSKTAAVQDLSGQNGLSSLSAIGKKGVLELVRGANLTTVTPLQNAG